MKYEKEHIKNELVRYIYQEMTIFESQKMRKLLAKESELQALFYELLDLKQEVDTLETSLKKPSQNVVDTILKYAKDHAPKDDDSLIKVHID